MSSKKDLASSRLVSKKEKIFNWIIFVLLLLGAVVMVFPLIYMIATSFGWGVNIKAVYKPFNYRL